MKTPRIDLDHAATSWPKPPEVLEAIAAWYAHYGVSPDRGDSGVHRQVADRIHATRQDIAARCGVEFAAPHVAFTSGATESLHLFLQGFLQPGDRVVTTQADHSAMLRPLHAMQSKGDLEVEILPVDPVLGIDMQAAVETMERQPPRLLAMTHASNVNGLVLQSESLMDAARRLGATTLLDASQTVGALPIDVGADAVVASAHKSLLGPPGCGFLAVRPGVESLRSPKQGGTSSTHATLEHPHRWPQGFEAGTPNTPAIFGLHAALKTSSPQATQARMERAAATCERLREALLHCRSTIQFVASPRTATTRPAAVSSAACLPILAFTVADQHPAETSGILSAQGLMVRAGHHCAPLAHRAFAGSTTVQPQGHFPDGSVRLSPGPDLTEDAVEAACAALRSL